LSAPRLGFGYSQNRHFLVAYLQHELIYRALVINDEVDRAADEMTAVVHAERARLSRQGERIKRVVEAFTQKPD